MSAHVRKIAIDEARAMLEAAGEAGEQSSPSAYDFAARWNAVEVGRTPSTILFHVNQADSPALPGDYVGDPDDIHPAQKPFVFSTYYYLPDSEERLGPIKLVDLPEDAIPSGDSFINHGFAGA